MRVKKFGYFLSIIITLHLTSCHNSLHHRIEDALQEQWTLLHLQSEPIVTTISAIDTIMGGDIAQLCAALTDAAHRLDAIDKQIERIIDSEDFRKRCAALQKTSPALIDQLDALVDETIYNSRFSLIEEKEKALQQLYTDSALLHTIHLTIYEVGYKLKERTEEVEPPLYALVDQQLSPPSICFFTTQHTTLSHPYTYQVMETMEVIAWLNDVYPEKLSYLEQLHQLVMQIERE